MNDNRANNAPRLAAYVRRILVGLLIAAAGLIPWTLLLQMNLRVYPDLPWAPLATVGAVLLLGPGLLIAAMLTGRWQHAPVPFFPEF